MARIYLTNLRQGRWSSGGKVDPSFFGENLKKHHFVRIYGMAISSKILLGLGLVDKSGDIAHPDFKSLLRPCCIRSIFDSI